MSGTPCLCGERNTWHKKCYQNQAAELKLLREQRDKLLEVLKEAEKWLSGWASAEPYLTIIRDAITAGEEN